MSWLNRKVEKSADEKALDDALRRYRERFGKAYVFQVGIGENTTKETVDEIDRLIKSGKPQTLEEYEEGALY